VWTRAALVVAVIAAPSPAAAERPFGIWLDLHVAPALLFDDATQPGVLYGVAGGYIVDRSGSFSIGLELDGTSTFSHSTRLDRGAVFATLTLWPAEHVSLALGAGIPVGPEALADGFAGFLRGGYAVRQWSRSALVIALDVNEDTTAGPQVSALIGLSIFTGNKTIDLWNPN
jgi:hypothetical protein